MKKLLLILLSGFIFSGCEDTIQTGSGGNTISIWLSFLLVITVFLYTVERNKC